MEFIFLVFFICRIGFLVVELVVDRVFDQEIVLIKLLIV